MPGYDQIAWLPLTAGLTVAGLIWSWFAWRRRGTAAGLRGVAWSLLPLAAYLTGVIRLIWDFGAAITSFAASFAFSPQVWAGVAVTGVSVALFTVSGGLRRRRRRNKDVAAARPASAPVAGPAAAGPAVAPGKSKAPAIPAGMDDDLGDVAEILKRHGIR